MDIREVNHILDFCADYFNKHDLSSEDFDYISANDAELISLQAVGIGWKAVVAMPHQLIYVLQTVDLEDSVTLEKYNSCGYSLFKWEYEDEA